MPFPDSPRVIYQRNPLRQVICQVRFPPILRIVTEPPAAFQDRVRDEYPLMRELRPDVSLEAIPPQIAQFIQGMLPGQARMIAYEFASADSAWSVTLSRDALALKAEPYRRWEEFYKHLSQCLCALGELYRPSFFTRLGLRYIDVIKRSTLGLDQHTPWSALLRPHIAGEFAAAEVADKIQHAAREVHVKLTGVGSVVIRHGTTKENDEQCFVIDSDFFTEGPLEAPSAQGILNDFNRKAGRLFRWCIQDVLHDAMGPTGVPRTRRDGESIQHDHGSLGAR